MNRAFTAAAVTVWMLTACSQEAEAPAPQTTQLERYVEPMLTNSTLRQGDGVTIAQSVIQHHPHLYGNQTHLIGTYLGILMDGTSAGAVRVATNLNTDDIHAYFERASDRAYLNRARAYAELETSLRADEPEVRAARLDLYLVEIPPAQSPPQELNAARYLLERTGLPVNDGNKHIVAARVRTMLAPPNASVAGTEYTP